MKDYNVNEFPLMTLPWSEVGLFYTS